MLGDKLNRHKKAEINSKFQKKGKKKNFKEKAFKS